MKKLILVFAALSLSFTLIAQSGKIGNLEWKLKKNTLIISGSGSIPNYKNKIPAWYECRKKIETVIMDDGVTGIGNWAFYSCEKLTSVTIPKSVTNIGDWAFYGCNNLATIEIPNSVTSIGDDAFGYCSGLTFITIPNSVKYIGDDAFEHCENLQTITIPEGVTKIGSGTFTYCAGMKTITLPNGITSIGNNAFSNCERLKAVVIPGSVESIGSSAFNFCPNLLTITATWGVPIEISDNHVFNQISALAVLYVPTRTKALYQKTEGWKDFRIIEDITLIAYTHTEKGDDKGGGELPSIDWTLSSNSNTDQKEFPLIACIKSTSKIEQVNIMVNRQKYKGIQPIPNDGCDFSINQIISLVDGPNTIKLQVANAKGINEMEKVIIYTPIPAASITVNKRYALIIGNSNYKSDPLNNPVNDAIDLEAKLKKLGFTTVLVKNATKEKMEDAIRNIAFEAQGYDAALFFYSGHAMNYDGKNHLIPVDINLQTPADLERCLDMDYVLGKMEDAKCKMKIVVLDACRNNPFPSWTKGVGDDKGLTGMDAPTGTFIAYSAAKGKLAQDGTGRNSPYTEAFLEMLDIPKLNILDFFQELGDKVKIKTKELQTPWTESSFSGKFYFNNK